MPRLHPWSDKTDMDDAIVSTTADVFHSFNLHATVEAGDYLVLGDGFQTSQTSNLPRRINYKRFGGDTNDIIVELTEFTTGTVPSSSHTDAQIDARAASQISQAIEGLTYDPGTNTYGGRRKTAANYPLEADDLANDTVVDKLTSDLADMTKRDALRAFVGLRFRPKGPPSLTSSLPTLPSRGMMTVTSSTLEGVPSCPYWCWRSSPSNLRRCRA